MRCSSGMCALAVCSVLVLLMSSSPVNAEARDHEDGFFLRLSAGLGSASTSTDVGSDSFARSSEFKLEGSCTDFNFAIGGVVSPNLAIHGTLYGWSIQNPDVTWSGLEGTAKGDLMVAAIGGGMTYYLMPANVYFSPSVGFGSLEFDAGSVSTETDYGLVLDFTVGKEWWVSDTWALGVAGGVTYHSIPEEGIEENWSGTSYAIRFTASMN